MRPCSTLHAGTADSVRRCSTHGIRYRGVDSTPEMVGAKPRARLGDDGAIEPGDLNDYVPPARRSPRRRSFVRSTTRPTGARSSGTSASTPAKLVFDLNPRQYASTTCSATCATQGSRQSWYDRSSSLRPSPCPARSSPPRACWNEAGRSRGSRFATVSRTWSQRRASCRTEAGSRRARSPHRGGGCRCCRPDRSRAGRRSA